MTPAVFSNSLSIRWDGKGIPYGGRGELRANGSANYGFKDLKGDPSLADEIPELQEDSALRSLVGAILQPSCGLFTVGCLSGVVDKPDGFRMTGYIEFAINSKLVVEDAGNYFPLFFHFDRTLHARNFDQRVQLDWELQVAHFLDANVDGFTCSVFVNTHSHASLSEAKVCWTKTLAELEQYLGHFPVQDGDPIYGNVA